MTNGELLKKQDLVDTLKYPRSTISDWLSEFAVFIPSVKRGARTLYRVETLDVLREIKYLRDQGLYKDEVFTTLKNKGYTMNVQEEKLPVHPVEHTEQEPQGGTITQMQQAIFVLMQQNHELAQQNQILLQEVQAVKEEQGKQKSDMKELKQDVNLFMAETGKQQSETVLRIERMDRQIEDVNRNWEESAATIMQSLEQQVQENEESTVLYDRMLDRLKQEKKEESEQKQQFQKEQMEREKQLQEELNRLKQQREEDEKRRIEREQELKEQAQRQIDGEIARLREEFAAAQAKKPSFLQKMFGKKG